MENQIRTHRFRWIALHSYHRHHAFVNGFFGGSEMLSFGVFCCDKKTIWHPRYLVSPPLYSTATTTSNTDINVTSEPLRVLSGSIWSRLGKHCHQRVAELWTDMFLPSSQTPLPVVLDSLRRELNMAKSVAFLERFEVLESIMTEVSFCSFWHQDGYRGRSRHKKWCKPVWTFFCTSRREGNLSRFHP